MRIRLASAGIALAAVLTACSSAAPPETPTAQSEAPSSIQPSASAPVAEPSPSAVETPTASPTAEAEREVPASCAGVPLTLGADLKGADLGGCVADALRSFGSGRMNLSSDTVSGTVDFTYAPDYAFHLAGESSGQKVDLTYVDGQIWLDQGQGPVKGDTGSGDQQEQLAGVTGELYRIFSDPAMTADLIAASAMWRIDPEKATRELPSGETVEAYRITNAEPFAWQSMPVQEFILWYGDDWTPVGAQGTLTVADQSSTLTQTFFDLGADITITAPA